MANHHFAKLGDVWKHLPLVEALALEPPALYCETHAGSAWYALTPSPERQLGVYTFLDRAPRHGALAASRYREVLAGLSGPDGLPRRYPGHPVLLEPFDCAAPR